MGASASICLVGAWSDHVGNSLFRLGGGGLWKALVGVRLGDGGGGELGYIPGGGE